MAGPHFSPLAIALFAALFAFMLYRRYRRTVGRQPLNPRRLLFQVGLLGLFTVLFLILSLGSVAGAAASLGGLIAGGLIGLAGLRLTRFERTPERDYFTPNLYLGLAVFGLFLGRLAYRLIQVSAQVQTLSAGGQTPPNLSGFTSNPLTAALLLMVFGYYLIYEGGLLVWVRRNPPAQAALLTKEGLSS